MSETNKNTVILVSILLCSVMFGIGMALSLFIIDSEAGKIYGSIFSFIFSVSILVYIILYLRKLPEDEE